MNAVAGAEARSGRRSFYVAAAVVAVVLPVLTFARSYWLQLPAGTVVGTPGLHLHAILFMAWPLLLLAQTWWVASGRTPRHRAWGMAGIALATAMVFSGIDSSLREMEHGLSTGDSAAIDFALGPIVWTLVFAGFFATAIACVSRPEIHKRLIILATIAILPPTVGHVFFSILIGDGPGLRAGLAGPAPIEALAAFALIADLLILAPIVYDWRTRGRPHRVYVIGGIVMVAAHVAVVPLSATGAWHGIVTVMANLQPAP